MRRARSFRLRLRGARFYLALGLLYLALIALIAAAWPPSQPTAQQCWRYDIVWTELGATWHEQATAVPTACPR